MRFFGRDNPVDGIVIEVLLDKAREIHRTLGTHVPVPEEGQSVTRAVLQAVFLRGRRGSARQLLLDLGVPQVAELHRRWDQDVKREKINRTRFAERALKPGKVQRELEATDAVLGDPSAVREFVVTASQRLGLPIAKDPKRENVYRINLGPTSLPPFPNRSSSPSPTIRYSPLATRPSYFSTRHPSLAQNLAREFRFSHPRGRRVSGVQPPLCGSARPLPSRRSAQWTRERQSLALRRALWTRAAHALTTIFPLRVRYLTKQPDRRPLLSEEVLVLGARDIGQGVVRWLDDGEALRLLAEAKPDANIPLAEKRELV